MNVLLSPSPLLDQIASVQQFGISAQEVIDANNLAFSHPPGA
jgi:hypothetical protein